jgi:hypothetical protein
MSRTEVLVQNQKLWHAIGVTNYGVGEMDKKYEYVQRELERRAGWKQLVTVAKQTGVSRRTIGNVLKGENVMLSTLDKLHDYLKENAKRRDL